MIMMMILLTVMVFLPLTPMKSSLMLTVWSIFAGLSVLNWSDSWIFLISVMVVNFSSAMMMIFCFCSMMSNFESTYKKNNYPKMMIFFMLIISVMLDYSDFNKINSPKEIIFLSDWWFFLICFIILFCMVSINYSMIMPKKKMIETY